MRGSVGRDAGEPSFRARKIAGAERRRRRATRPRQWDGFDIRYAPVPAFRSSCRGAAVYDEFRKAKGAGSFMALVPLSIWVPERAWGSRCRNFKSAALAASAEASVKSKAPLWFCS